MILVRTLLLVILFSAFVGLWIWAWSKQRQPEFDAAARLPLLDDGEPATYGKDSC